jgi:hypothetical protein
MVSMNIKSDDAVESAEYDPSPCIYLNDDQVEALGITTMPAPGTTFTMTARVVVRSVTATAEEPEEVAAEGTAPDISLTLCVAEMELAPAAAPADGMAVRLYA